MPQMYEHPQAFLRGLAEQVSCGWVLIQFDYDKEQVVLMKEGELLKAVLRHGRVEWVTPSVREEEVIRGTDKFFIL